MSFNSINRRTFLGTAGTVTAATLLTSKLGWAAKLSNSSIGVQLYTVRDLMKNDFEGTIAKVAQVGYKERGVRWLFRSHRETGSGHSR